jgi:murein L,D-transpeptidase YafK
MNNIKKQILATFIILCTLQSFSQKFKEEQMKNERVKASYSETWMSLRTELTMQGINKDNFEMYIRIFKEEQTVEVWLKSEHQTKYQLFKTFAICTPSGTLGPKRHEGDMQVPEGFYEVSLFNPNSNYYLSLGINYPNKSDKIIGKTNLGGDIMIHGNCVTIGCIPITDEKIKQLYILAVEARSSGQKTIPVHIFPSKLDDKEMKTLEANYKDASLIFFWKNIKTGYDYFENKKLLPVVSVDKDGKYLFK